MEMKGFMKYWVEPNIVDIMYWAAVLVFAIKYGVLNWHKENPWLFVLFMCFYGGFLIYRLGVRNKLQDKLIQKCKDAGIDISDILPPGSY